MAKRMPVRPEQSASAVTALGTTARKGIPRRSDDLTRAGSLGFSLGDALAGFIFAQLRDHRLPGNGPLAEKDVGRGAGGKIDVDAAAETDEADALAGGDMVPRLHPRHDTAGDEAGDLGEAGAGGGGRFREG